jgi:hypothetical protein
LGGVLWLLYMSLEPFIERSYPRAMRDWILVTHGYFGEVGVALRIIAGAMLGVLATPLLAGAQNAHSRFVGLAGTLRNSAY